MVSMVKLECSIKKDRILQIYVREFLNFIGVHYYVEYVDRDVTEQNGIRASDKINKSICLTNYTDEEYEEAIQKAIEEVCGSEEEKDCAYKASKLFVCKNVIKSIYYLKYLGNRRDLVNSYKIYLHGMAIKLEELNMPRNIISDYISLNMLYYAVLGSGDSRDRNTELSKQFESKAKNIQLIYGSNMYLDSIMIKYYISRKLNGTACSYYMQNKKEFNYGMFSNLAYIYKHGKYFVINNSQVLKLPAIKNPNDSKNFYISACKANDSNDIETGIKVCKQALALIDKSLEFNTIEPDEIIFGIKYIEMLLDMGDTLNGINYCERLLSNGMEQGSNIILEYIFGEDALKVMADIIDNCSILSIVKSYADKYRDSGDFDSAIVLYNNALIRYGNTTIGLEKRAVENMLESSQSKVE